MAQVIQAKCPHCQHVLRMPAEWLGQAMRCKHCRQVFQATVRDGPVAPAAPPTVRPQAITAAPTARAAITSYPIAVPAAAPPGASPFAFDDPAESAAPRSYRRRRKGGWLKGALLGICFLGVAAATVYFAGPQLLELLDRQAEKKSEQYANRTMTTPERRGPTTHPGPRIQPPGPKGGERGPPPAREKVRPRPKTTPKAGPPTGKETAPPKIETPPKKGPDPKIVRNPKDKKGPAAAKGLFPRRALAISIGEYWLANPLGYGRAQDRNFPGSSTAAVLKELGKYRLHFPNTQLTELSDQGLDPHPPLKPVVEGTIIDFLNTCRNQDRIILLFAGHAAEIGKEAYLVPVLGDLKDVKTLIPLRWVYDKLKECKARQKVLILDVCRFDPARGMERPGSAKMGMVLDAMLQQPPPGVQVWSSCVAGQNSYEFESGSFFLQALCLAMQERLPGLQEPGLALPLETLRDRVNVLLAKSLAPQKLEQTSRLTGKEMAGGAPYNPAEPLPPPLVVRQAPVRGGDAANPATVQKILDEIAAVPPPRVGRPGVQDNFNVKVLPPYPAKVLETYAADYRSWQDFADKEKEFPLRAAVVKAVKALEENATKFRMKEFFGGATTVAVKKKVLKEQAAPGKAILSLKEALEELQQAGKKRKKEMSKRWQVNFDYVQARLEARLVYLYQYDYVLAKIRTDSLPPLANGFSGFRLGSMKRVTVPESEVKGWVKDIDRKWKKIIHDYPDTPWALIARREQLTVLGLEWRPSRE